MKLASFIKDGKATYGGVTGDRLVDLGPNFGNRFPDLKSLRPSEPDEHTLPTLVREGSTIGAGCIIGNDLEIGRWAMVGMGSVVTRSVPDFHLVLGSPARSIGAVCKCGHLIHKFSSEDPETFEKKCTVCDLSYAVNSMFVTEK